MYHPLRRALFAIVACATTLVSGDYSTCQEPGESDVPADEISLEVGDKAPQFHVDQWLGGTPIESFSKDNVYVVEFWATWCSPCIKSMPHLSELAERYAKEGLIVIAMTKTDEANTRAAVERFTQGPGEKYRFRYALCEGEATYRDYMQAAGQKGIPCSFVIDREGKIAYIGLPYDLDYVLERVIKGQWRGKADADELRELSESISKLGELAQTDPDKALRIADQVRRVHPNRAKGLDFAFGELLALCKKQLFDRAKQTVESVSDRTKGSVDWGAVAMLSGLLASRELNPEGKHREYAIAQLQAAEVALQDDWQNLLQVGLAYQLSGQLEKYKACMDKAIAICPDEQIKKSLQTAYELQMKIQGK